MIIRTRRVTVCSGPRGRTQREGYATRRRPGWDGGKNAGGWRGRTAHGPAKDARVQANIRKVPAHEQLINDRVGKKDQERFPLTNDAWNKQESHTILLINRLKIIIYY